MGRPTYLDSVLRVVRVQVVRQLHVHAVDQDRTVLSLFKAVCDLTVGRLRPKIDRRRLVPEIARPGDRPERFHQAGRHEDEDE